MEQFLPFHLSFFFFFQTETKLNLILFYQKAVYVVCLPHYMPCLATETSLEISACFDFWGLCFMRTNYLFLGGFLNFLNSL